MKNKKWFTYVQASLFPLFLGSIMLLGILSRSYWGPLLSEPENLRNWIDSKGISGPLFFIGIQIIQVVIFIIPGEVTQAGAGYIFGVFYGSLYSIIGILIGSFVNFYIARFLGIRFVQSILPKEQFLKFEGLIGTPRMVIGFFLFFLIPGIPKDALCYFAGLSPLPFWMFLTMSMVGRFPGILGSAVIGSSVASSKPWLAALVLVISLMIFVIAAVSKERLHKWVAEIAELRSHHNIRNKKGFPEG